ncbi:hypothetical protein [Streptomyces sp. NPDC127197]|uniref:hypothetical protein n=1 Tax=Streptomyces sp. NPDC127197 TaxID=3345388 RepID=UPI0036313C81
MTATSATNQPAVPDWLAAAEAAHQEQQIDVVAQGLLRAQRHADLINARLAELGIEPIAAAGIDDRGNLTPARLTVPEFEPYAYYEVRAAWSEDNKEVELHTADWEDDRPKFGRVRLLNSLADVAAARPPNSPLRHATTARKRSGRWTASTPTTSMTPASKRSRRPSTATPRRCCTSPPPSPAPTPLPERPLSARSGRHHRPPAPAPKETDHP